MLARRPCPRSWTRRRVALAPGGGPGKLGLESGNGTVKVAGVEAGEESPERAEATAPAVDAERDLAALAARFYDVVVAQAQPQERALLAESATIVELGDRDRG